MQLSKKITVIIPFTKKHEKYIQGAIKSIPKDIRVITYFDELYMGPWFCRTKLARQVETEWIAMLDADDICLPIRFNIDYPDADFIYTNFKTVNHKGYTKVHKLNPFDFDLLLKKNIIPFSTVIFKKSILEKIPFPIGYSPKTKGLDWLWNIQVARAEFKVVLIPEITVSRRTYTSHFHSSIPVWRKFKRIYQNRKVRKLICAMD